MTPKILESAALKIAPEVLPLATDVSTTDVETVDGNTHRYRKPSRRALGSEGQIMGVISWKAKPTIGNRRKVKLWMIRWSRQLPAPLLIRSTAIANPCTKRIKAIPALFKRYGCIQPPLAPGLGKRKASATEQNRAIMNPFCRLPLFCLRFFIQSIGVAGSARRVSL